MFLLGNEFIAYIFHSLELVLNIYIFISCLLGASTMSSSRETVQKMICVRNIFSMVK